MRGRRDGKGPLSVGSCGKFRVATVTRMRLETGEASGEGLWKASEGLGLHPSHHPSTCKFSSPQNLVFCLLLGAPGHKRILGANRPLEVHRIYSHVLSGGLDLNCPGHVRHFPVSEACHRRPYNLTMSPIGWYRSPHPNSFPLQFQFIFIDSQRNENSLRLL